MKEEWKVYIKGVPNRGDEIIKILTNLGANNDYNYDGYASNYFIYFINHEGNISSASINSEPAKIIMDNYYEIKLPGPWKDGDILINKSRTEYTIFKGYSYGTIFYTYSFSIRIDKEDIIRYRSNEGENLYENEDFRLATSEEVEQFHNILHKYHKEWDAERKQIVDWKWKPKKGERYWFIGGHGQIRSYVWNNDFADIDFFNFGNYFKTKEEAEAIAEKFKKLLKNKL